MWLRPLLVCLVLCILIQLTFSEESMSREERGARKNKQRKNNKRACKYTKGNDWGPCEEGKKTRNATLKRSRRGQTCEPFKVQEKDCKVKGQAKVEKCVYEKRNIKWSKCIDGNKTKVRQLASGSNCDQTKTITKTCRNRAARTGRDSTNVVKGCKYERGTWSDCVDGKRTRTSTLKKGDAAKCDATKVDEKNCKTKTKKPVACKYQAAEGWGPCTSGQKVKELTLKPGGPADCEATKSLRKRCKAKECKYKKGAIGTCNTVTNMLNRTDVLKDGADASCPPTKAVEVPCDKPNSKPKSCNYGAWKEYGPCMNGVKRKTRDITLGQGNQRCEKKSVKIMACEDQDETQGNSK